MKDWRDQDSKGSDRGESRDWEREDRYEKEVRKYMAGKTNKRSKNRVPKFRVRG